MKDGVNPLFAAGRYLNRICLDDTPLLDSRRVYTLLAIPL